MHLAILTQVFLKFTELYSSPVNIYFHWFVSNPEGPRLPLVTVAARFNASSSKLSKIDGWNGSTFSDGDPIICLLTSPGLGCFSFNTWSTVLSPILSDKSSTPPSLPCSSCLMAFATFPFVMCLTKSFLVVADNAILMQLTNFLPTLLL